MAPDRPSGPGSDGHTDTDVSSADEDLTRFHTGMLVPNRPAGRDSFPGRVRFDSISQGNWSLTARQVGTPSLGESDMTPFSPGDVGP